MLAHLVAALSVTAPIRRVAYFDAQNAIVRGPAPSTAPRVYFPVHRGLSLIAGSEGAYSAAMLTEAQVGSLTAEDGAVVACVGRAVASSPLASRAAEVAGCAAGEASLWLLDVSHREEPPELSSGAWLPIRGGAGAYSVLEGLQEDEVSLVPLYTRTETRRGTRRAHQAGRRRLARGNRGSPRSFHQFKGSALARSLRRNVGFNSTDIGRGTLHLP